MSRIDELRAALAEETGRRQLAETRLADCHRQLADARGTIDALTRLAVSAPGVTACGAIATARRKGGFR